MKLADQSKDLPKEQVIGLMRAHLARFGYDTSAMSDEQIEAEAGEFWLQAFNKIGLAVVDCCKALTKTLADLEKVHIRNEPLR